MSHWETTGKSNEWYTPKYIFDSMGITFDMDVCAPFDTSKIFTPTNSFITKNSLSEKWNGFVWMNPPFGGRNGLAPWLDKINNHGNGIALTPDRSSAPWWQTAAKQCDALLLVANKIKFINSDGEYGNQPGSGTTLFAYGPMAVNALKNAQKNGLGLLFSKTL